MKADQVRISIPFVGGVTAIYNKDEIQRSKENTVKYLNALKSKLSSVVCAAPKVVIGAAIITKSIVAVQTVKVLNTIEVCSKLGAEYIETHKKA